MRTCTAFLLLLLTLFGAPVSAEEAIVTGPDRRHEIDLRIAELDAERDAISTTLPKVLTFVGVGVVVTGGIVLAGGFLSSVEGKDKPRNDNVISAGYTLLGFGGILAFTGGTGWGVQATRRKGIDAERDSLIEERDGLEAALSRIELRTPYRDSTQFVTLGVRF